MSRPAPNSSQNSLAEVEEWIKGSVYEGKVASASTIRIHALACSTNETDDGYIAQPIPYISLPKVKYEKINDTWITEDFYEYHSLEDGSPTIIVTSIDATGNRSEHSNVVSFE